MFQGKDEIHKLYKLLRYYKLSLRLFTCEDHCKFFPTCCASFKNKILRRRKEKRKENLQKYWHSDERSKSKRETDWRIRAVKRELYSRSSRWRRYFSVANRVDAPSALQVTVRVIENNSVTSRTPVITRNDTDGQRFAPADKDRGSARYIRSISRERWRDIAPLAQSQRSTRARREERTRRTHDTCARFIGIFAAAVSLLSARLTTPPTPVSPTSFSRCREIVSAILHPLYPRVESRRNDPFRSDEWISGSARFHRSTYAKTPGTEISVAKQRRMANSMVETEKAWEWNLRVQRFKNFSNMFDWVQSVFTFIVIAKGIAQPAFSRVSFTK